MPALAACLYSPSEFDSPRKREMIVSVAVKLARMRSCANAKCVRRYIALDALGGAHFGSLDERRRLINSGGSNSVERDLGIGRIYLAMQIGIE
ncbi:hypothetical protein CEXT_461341 [Caerostris extrusa]|uniref:Uncharacterized protein n=1 Tax=Caerostris extrusa TaxID=172846 RepID=A0AAV4XPD9_CAEEX|nr:hypothetical protein CEXT_461341 [Caerostris extrusa]